MNNALLASDYYSQPANEAYMSHSQYSDFCTCEAYAMVKLTGEWVEESTDAMLAGSYVHAWSEGTLDQFKSEHPEMFTKQGDLKAPFKQAEAMIGTLKNDELIMSVLQGEKEKVVVTEFAGCMWKAKLDVLNETMGRIVDIKTTKSLHERTWDKNDERYVSFVEARNYTRQLALYVELEKRLSGRSRWLKPLIVAVTKEDHPDKAIITIDEERIEFELDNVKRNIDRILLVKNGYVEPERCERCAYCRTTKKLTSFIHYSELI